MFKGLGQIGYLVEDLDAAIKVHEQAFGATLVKRWVSKATGSEVAVVQVGNSRVELVSAGPNSQNPVKGWVLDSVCYEVDDLDKAVAELSSAGRPTAGPPAQGVTGGKLVNMDRSVLGGTRVKVRQW